MKRFISEIFGALLATLSLFPVGCGEDGSVENGSNANSEEDSSPEADSDTDADSSPEGDTDTNSGGDEDITDGCRVFMDPNGVDGEDCGAADSPCATLAAAYNVLCPVPPDGTENGAECLGPAPRTLCVRSGTYPMTERFELRKTRMGAEANPIVIQASPDATSKPVFDFSSQPRVASCGAQSDSSGGDLNGITMNADWTVLRNLVVADANDSCVHVQGANNLVENVVVHDCDGAGIEISAGSGYAGSGTNNLILNIDSYNNYDAQCFARKADGFAATSGTGAGNVFRGCRAWNNGDDGWDLTAWTSPVRLENCWAVNQCATVEDLQSDCNGFMLGGNEVETEHVLIDLVAVGNTGGRMGFGFSPDTNPAEMVCEGTCAAWGNGVDVNAVGGISTAAIGGVTADRMIGAEREADGSLPSMDTL